MKINVQSKRAVPIWGLVALLGFAATVLGSEDIVVPGERIGKIRLGMTSEEVYKLIGQPQYAEGAMGKSFETWRFLGQTQIDINFQRDSEGRRFYARQIRVNSVDYMVSGNKVSIASKMDEIWKAFPNTAYGSTVRSESGNPVDIYADATRGIAFEIRRESRSSGDWGRCQAIIIHLPGEPLTQMSLLAGGESRN